MKKLLFVLLFFKVCIMSSQTYQSPTFATITTKTAPTVTTTPHLGAIGADGKINKILPSSDIITNSSTVTGASVTNALNTLKDAIPISYTKVIYVNATNPNSATVFDDENPPVINDNSFKADVNNLYVGTDSSGWVYSASTLNYTSKVIPLNSNFYLSGAIDAGNNKTLPIYRTGNIAIGTNSSAIAKLSLTGGITGGTTGYGYYNQSVIQSDVTAFAWYNRTMLNTQAAVFNVPDAYHYSAGQGTIGIGSSIGSQYGFIAESSLTGATNNYGFRGNIASGTGRWNVYMAGTANNHFNGSVGIGIAIPTSKLTVVNTSAGSHVNTIMASNISGTIGTSCGVFLAPTSLQDGTKGALLSAVQKGSDGVDMLFSTGSGVAMVERMRIVDISGNIGIATTPTSTSTDKLQVNGNIVASAATLANHVVIKSQSDLKSDIASPLFTGDPKAPTPTAGDNDTSIATTAFVNSSGTPKITITTAVSITTATTDAGGLGQNGRHVIIDNGASIINITCNGGVTTSYGKVGTGAITFVQGSGRTLVQLSGTAVMNGIAGSTATLWSNGATDYLLITNY